MGFSVDTHSVLVQEIIDTVISRFEALSVAERKQAANALVEAAAWFAAMETTTVCKKNGFNSQLAMERASDFEDLFSQKIEDVANCFET